MLVKRLIFTLTFLNGILFGTRNFIPDYRYTHNFVDTWDIDEIILLDITKKKEGERENFYKILQNFSKKCFVPITAGGNVENLSEIEKLLKLGADKIAINTATKDEEFIKKASETFGSNCIVASVDCKKENDKYKIFLNRGTEEIIFDPAKYAKKIQLLGAGEILIQSIDKDGTLQGYDIELINLISKDLNIPTLACSGAGNWQHFLDCFMKTNVAGVCTTNIYHFTNSSVINAKKFLNKKQIIVRMPKISNNLTI
tara:strand:+ start:2074 stop:2841 length:768 start_codon:yes stop_codon:yes gene_type:complete